MAPFSRKQLSLVVIFTLCECFYCLPQENFHSNFQEDEIGLRMKNERREELEKSRARFEQRRGHPTDKETNERNSRLMKKNAIMDDDNNIRKSSSDMHRDIDEKMRRFDLHQEALTKEFESRRNEIEQRHKDGIRTPLDMGMLEDRYKHKMDHLNNQNFMAGDELDVKLAHMKNEDSIGAFTGIEGKGEKRNRPNFDLGGGDHLNHPRVIEAQERLAKARARRNERALSKIDKRIARISKHAEKQGFDDEKMQRIQAELQAVLNDEGAEGEEEERTEARLERLRKVEFEVMGHTDPHGHRDIRGDFREQMKSMHGDL